MRFALRASTDADLAWLSVRTGWKFTENARGITASNSKCEARGVIAYDEWTPNSVRAHVACDTPAAWRALVPACFEYPFRECGKRLLLVGVTADNTRSLHSVQTLGFKEVHRVRDGWADGVDLLLFQMRREECRYLHRKAA